MNSETRIVHYGKYRGIDIAVAHGDILGSGAECVAVSGNAQGKMGGGVSGAICRAAGTKIEESSEQASPIKVGKSIILPPHGLASLGIKGVAYAAVMPQPIDSTNATIIEQATLSLLSEAKRQHYKSVAIPLMGGGVGKLPRRISAGAIVQAARKFFQNNLSTKSIEKIVFCGYTKEDSVAFIQALNELYGLKIENSGLLIIDMIETFVGDDSLISEQDSNRICEKINSMITVAVQKDHPLCFVKDVHSASDRELIYAHPHGVKNPEEINFEKQLLIPDGPLTFFVNKHAYSAFFETDLYARLKSYAVDTVIIMGNQTHVCIKHTAAAAMMHGFRPIVIADCTTSSTLERHQLGLYEISRYIGEVSESSYLADVLLATLY